MNHDNPFNVFEPKGLTTHGVGTFLKHAYVHVVERCDNRNLIHIHSLLNCSFEILNRLCQTFIKRNFWRPI